MIARDIQLGGGQRAKGGGKANAPAGAVAVSPGGSTSKVDVTARAIAGSLQAPLNAAQKQAICTAARLAYDTKGGSATGWTFEEFRRGQQEQACGVASLRDCRQHHFKLLQGHFDLLNGRTVNAFRKFVGQSGEGQKRELALAKLRHEAQRAFAAPGSCFANAQAAYDYVAGFLRNKRKVVLENADAKDIWHGIYVLRGKVARFGESGENTPAPGKPVAVSPGGSTSSRVEGSAETRHNAILGGGGDGRAQDRDFSGGPLSDNPQTTANEFRGTP